MIGGCTGSHTLRSKPGATSGSSWDGRGSNQLLDLHQLALNDPDFMSTAVDIALTESALRPIAAMEDDEEQAQVCLELKEGEEEITPGRIKKVIRDMYPPEPKEKDHYPEYEEVCLDVI